MKIKLAVFFGMGLLAMAVVVGLFGNLPQTSAEEFADGFRAPGVSLDDEKMSGTYEFDKNHSTIGFRVKHMGLIEVPGYFRDFSGKVIYDAADMKKSSVEFTAQMTSVDTGVAPRDNHLRSKDFFEIEKYPQMTFKSTRVMKNGETWMVTGNLTMKDVTKEVSFPFNIAGFVESRGKMTMGITAETTINRRDFNVNYGGNMPNGSPMLSDEIKVNLQIEAGMVQLVQKADG